MKYREILLSRLESLPHFSKRDVCQLSGQYGIKDTTVDAYISRSLVRRDLIRLKKGMYVTADFCEKNRGDTAYAFFLANVLRTPSYVSSWTALQYYDLATEVVHSITSVTPKATRDFHTRAGNFSYHSIKKEFFYGFLLVKGKFDFFISSPAKALFDLLYFRTHQFRGIRAEEITGIVESLRIDIEEMERKERGAFHHLIKNFFAESRG